MENKKNKLSKVAVILAAGKGKRMKSDIPKVLHRILGKPMVEYVIENSRKAGFEKIILIVGHKYQQVMDELKDADVEFVVQHKQLGTGDAVLTAKPKLANFEGTILVLAGDMPLVSADTIIKLTNTHRRRSAAATVLTVKLPDPTGYGRIVRNSEGAFIGITEHRDADEETRRIDEVNTGIICFDSAKLFEVLPLLSNDNDQREYYLTDCISLLVNRGETVEALVAENYLEGEGINSIEQLKEVEDILREKSIDSKGVDNLTGSV